MSPVSKKRKQPARRAKSSPAHPSLVAAALKAFAERLDDSGPLQSELLASFFLGAAWAGSEWGRVEAAEALASELIDAKVLKHRAGGLMLKALAVVGPDATRESARQLFALGQAQTSTPWQLPEWSDRFGTAVLERSAQTTDVFGDQVSYYLGFAYPGAADPEPHLVAVLVDYNLHLVKDMFVRVGPGIFEFIRDLTNDDEGALHGPMNAQSAADDIWYHLDITDRTIGEPFGEESADTRFVLQARLAALPAPNPDFAPDVEVPEAERDRIVESFMRTAAVKRLLAGEGSDEEPPTRDGIRFITRCALQYACDYGVGDPLRWSPTAVELFLADWAPRKVNWEPEDALWLPDVLDAFVEYCGRKKKLATRWVEETRAAIDEFAGDFLAAELEGSSKGPAAQIVAQMLADGVDIMDQAATQAWIDRYNSLL